MSKQIEISNPRPGDQRRTSEKMAAKYLADGRAVMKEGCLLFLGRALGIRMESDVYVDQRGTIWWNGARAHYVAGHDVAMFPPFCNVVFPKTGTRAAARRYAS